MSGRRALVPTPERPVQVTALQPRRRAAERRQSAIGERARERAAGTEATRREKGGGGAWRLFPCMLFPCAVTRVTRRREQLRVLGVRDEGPIPRRKRRGGSGCGASRRRRRTCAGRLVRSTKVHVVVTVRFTPRHRASRPRCRVCQKSHRHTFTCCKQIFPTHSGHERGTMTARPRPPHAGGRQDHGELQAGSLKLMAMLIGGCGEKYGSCVREK